jgi:hypothetical protein
VPLEAVCLVSQFRTILFRRNRVDVGKFDNDENGTFASSPFGGSSTIPGLNSGLARTYLCFTAGYFINIKYAPRHVVRILVILLDG